ncbi:archaetidylserine decarboxylase [Sandaracinus amylolyticus]|uniref:archaetidylserine decarboxylase n=1 Tax=Sandaracinus amylolyticus TaxID=927083 RepID=UPI001EED29C0|nr:archaetidylserine decarboxylase [Sandaracinus amylolyticus]UJR81721.1 Phosphatidylserine decarboxylase proenzyme [Sandaracinus amylolyticus]
MLASRIAAETLRFLPRKRISRVLGRMASAGVPVPLLQRAIDLYVRAYAVDLSECDVPSGGWTSFNQFFTRPLRDGCRPIDPDPGAIVSPADGLVEDCGTIDARATFRVKGRPYDVGELLGDERDASRYEGGRFAIIYLSPRDYHRVHAAVEGPVRVVRHVGGTLFPVNKIGLEHVPGLFAKNERVAVFQESPVHGEVATILVGAIVVGSVTLTFDPAMRTNDGPPRGTVRYLPGREPTLGRGDELGAFQLGSTVIVLTTRRSEIELAVEPGTPVRMGQVIARRVRGGRSVS